MYQSPLGLQASPTPMEVAPDPRPLRALPQCHLCHELLTELLICVIHSELSQESSHERQD